jgi:hypothetical protein
VSERVHFDDLSSVKKRVEVSETREAGSPGRMMRKYHPPVVDRQRSRPRVRFGMEEGVGPRNA